ncbi:MAG: gliding motility protein GldM [Bacteroidota bacterium]
MGGEVIGPGKLSARGKMINMMYLVLIALLALNVSKEVLDAFVIINQGLVETTDNFSEKNLKIYANFDKAAASNPDKAGPWRLRAYEIKERATSLYQYIEDLKIELAMKIDGLDNPDEVDFVSKEGIKNKKDTEIPAIMFITEGRGDKLMGEINEFRDFIIGQIKPKDEAFKITIANSLDTSDPPATTEGGHLTWVQEHFEFLPAIAVVANMSQLQSQVRNAEAEVITYLEQEIEAGAIKFNKVEAIVIPEKTYVVQGDTFRADVFLAASDSMTPPSVYVGEFDSVTLNMVGEFDSLKVQRGKGKMKVKADKMGLQEWGGVIKLKTLAGMKQYSFHSEYEVAKPSITVSADMMNVFYIGPDNPVTVAASGFPDNKVKASISGGGGSIRKTSKPGSWIVKVSTQGKANVNVQVENQPGKWKSMGSAEFRVKRVPDPVSYFVGKKGDATIKKSELLAGMGIQAKMENFDFDLKFIVNSFDMTMSIGGVFQTINANGYKINDQMKKYLEQAKRGTKIYFEKIRAKGPDGSTRELGPISLSVI